MEPLYPCCAGLDVHKETVVACLRRISNGGRVTKQVRTFATMTSGLLALGDWLETEGASHAAMESTGEYWKPVYHLLEGRCELLLVNAQHIKRVPGRKTDVKDCEWIAQLLQHGLLKASFVPPASIRALRDLTRQRAQLVAEVNRVANRLQKVLEDANIKLGCVASDILGVSGRRMLEALMEGQTDPVALAELAKGKLKEKRPALREALAGKVTEHHRFMLRMHWDHLRSVEGLIERLTTRLETEMAPFAEAVQRLDTIPGVDQWTAQNVIAEIGVDMERFRSAADLASWAGVCPGNHESAGKRRSSRTNKGNRWLRRALVQAAWAASHTKQTYLSSQYRRLAARRGRKRALVALGHTLIVIIYQMLRKQTVYADLGADYFDRLQTDRLTRSLVKRLEKMGHQVTLSPAA